MIDAAGLVLTSVVPANYIQQWVVCAFGIFFVALGVSMEVEAGLVTTAGEGTILAVCKVAPVKFSNMKVAFDVTLVCLSVALSVAFLGKIDGLGKVRWPRRFAWGL